MYWETNSMPQRPHSHRVRDVAALAVESIFAAQGWATEPIRQDYGEDLLVQPARGDEMENFKLWVQVKGTASDSTSPWRVSKEHALRWILSRDYVVFVVWDPRSQRGKYALPRHQFRSSDLNFQNVSTVELEPHGDLDAIAVLQLHWIALFEHYEYQIYACKSYGGWNPFSKGGDAWSASTGEEVIRIILPIVWDLLGRLNIVLADKSFSSKFLKQWAETNESILADSQQTAALTKLDLDPFVAKTMIVLMEWANDNLKITPPPQVIHTCATILQIMQTNQFIERIDRG